ncbi:hypothetical protein NUW54_g11167 [Trametes sanguinea]|uniref:Uncharacterized protein n=1 Tax=Trametes sanguinea TaxID=158606 RepID=A0ACC1NIV8_9APHY|nr:hypothetical protein NUW54_g11167 [Trametes sanguinea]
MGLRLLLQDILELDFLLAQLDTGKAYLLQLPRQDVDYTLFLGFILIYEIFAAAGTGRREAANGRGNRHDGLETHTLSSPRPSSADVTVRSKEDPQI